jgi:hypothetical protein
MILHERADELFDGSFGRVPEKLARIDILCSGRLRVHGFLNIHGFYNTGARLPQ